MQIEFQITKPKNYSVLNGIRFYDILQIKFLRNITKSS
jgi:hypothetical protein